jgi:hypothetical protein
MEEFEQIHLEYESGKTLTELKSLGNHSSFHNRIMWDKRTIE